jgi:hypothetical protein
MSTPSRRDSNKTASGKPGAVQSNLGTVFKLTPPAAGQTAWTETVLVSFNGTNGQYPF